MELARKPLRKKGRPPGPGSCVLLAMRQQLGPQIVNHLLIRLELLLLILVAFSSARYVQTLLLAFVAQEIDLLSQVIDLADQRDILLHDSHIVLPMYLGILQQLALE